MSKQADEKELLLFIEAISKINPIEFLGVATLLHVSGFKDDEWKIPRKADEILSDVIDAFIVADEKERKKLLQKIKKAGRNHKCQPSNQK